MEKNNFKSLELLILQFGKNIKFVIFPMLIFSLNSCIDERITECDPCSSPISYEGYSNVFTEEFNSASFDEDWNFIQGNGCPEACGWGSGELQSHNKDNVEILNGNLIITAKKETIGDSQYTSGRISTLDTFSLTFGRIDVRAKLPKGQGLWAGVWLLGDKIKEVSWPTPGHISLLEMRGGEIDGRNNTLVGKIIYGTPKNVQTFSNFTSLENGIFNDKFHVFSIIWEPNKIQWLLNDKVYFEKIIDASMIDTFTKPFHLNINLAVGGQFPGNPNTSTVFPQELVIDYIRVFQK
ncbi:glycosyl hydrolase family 16 [Algoriphagus ratkowskyi]|uniref:Glycoside hydrolase family 16 protein n=1 Tax=Algoriphagus ratkowskyi TaxID=57028 RepID=A0A2W7RKT9_9BACT|nr:glycoside hydrolase family 16 protein [Algoriphagus ratkowskyi]PZX51295.1 glycosyl hydrolase family 16 [Algoriphagus ratkowskyi]TXD75915.1 glycoside hydrolase family 16 protein [Algoriphagus ratkowskyi]